MSSSAHVESHDNVIVLNFDSLEAAMKLLSPWRGARPRAEAIKQISSALSAAGLNIDLRIKGRTMAQLVAGQLNGPLAVMLGVRDS